MSDEQGLVFPCRYPLKIMGEAGAAFREAIVDEIRDELGAEPVEIRTRSSRQGKYQSVTIVVDVASRDILEKTYARLARRSDVLYTL